LAQTKILPLRNAEKNQIGVKARRGSYAVSVRQKQIADASLAAM